MVDVNAMQNYLDQALRNEFFFLDSIQSQRAGKRVLITVVIDCLRPLTLNDVAQASRIIDEKLEGQDFLGQTPYTLEVTTRGVDAGLEKPHHYALNIGRLVNVTFDDGRIETYRIASADEFSFTSDENVTVFFNDITLAKVQIEFNRKAHDEN